jgi:transposase
LPRKIVLSTDEAYLLAEKLKETQSRKLSRRLLALSLRHYGYPIGHIARLTGVSARTVSGWLDQYLKGGFEALLALSYPEQRNSRLAGQQGAIRAFFQARPQASIQDLQAWLREEAGVEVEYSWLCRYLARRGLRKA